MTDTKKYDYELIKDYLDGILDDQAAAKVKSLIENDDIARAMAKGILLLEDKFDGNNEQIEEYLDELLRQRLSLIKKPGRMYFLKIAAALLLIAVGGFSLYKFTDTNLDSWVDKELADPYKAPVGFRDGEFEMAEGMKAYAAGDYAKAIEGLRNGQSSSSIFFLGLSHLYSGKYNSAIHNLGDARLDGSRFEEQRNWYLALAYMKVNDNDRAKELLARMAALKDHFKWKEAALLLEKM